MGIVLDATFYTDSDFKPLWACQTFCLLPDPKAALHSCSVFDFISIRHNSLEDRRKMTNGYVASSERLTNWIECARKRS
jgi:hypothetical protein